MSTPIDTEILSERHSRLRGETTHFPWNMLAVHLARIGASMWNHSPCTNKFNCNSKLRLYIIFGFEWAGEKKPGSVRQAEDLWQSARQLKSMSGEGRKSTHVPCRTASGIEFLISGRRRNNDLGIFHPSILLLGAPDD
jgi:hypothetical protein